MEYTCINPADIETAAVYGQRAHAAAMHEVSTRSGLSFRRVCELASTGNLGEAVRLIELRRAPRVDPRKRRLELLRRAHPELERAEPVGPFFRHVPTAS